MRHAARLARFATAAGDRRLVGRTFGAWRLDAVLGQGRFGTCFRASRASGEPRSAALKLIKPEQGSLDRDALWREAKALSLCAHPAVPRWLGIVRERDDARDRGRCFMAQSLMPGTSLDRLLFRQRRSFDQAAIASIGRQVIDALAHLEGRGVAHGDVRPANLLIDAEGTVSLVDFGLAGFFDRNAASPAATASDRAGLADVLLRSSPGSTTSTSRPPSAPCCSTCSRTSPYCTASRRSAMPSRRRSQRRRRPDARRGTSRRSSR